jgi:hypothetical protein
MKVVVDKCVSEEEILGLPGRLKSMHLASAAAGRPMRVLGAIVQISAFSGGYTDSNWCRHSGGNGGDWGASG